MMADRPLVSFCVKSYNHRAYLAAALEGALAQTYRPLEIVVSDDCSTDGSWEEIERFFAAARAAGRLEGLEVRLHRNERNLGNLGNWERLCELAHGELLVKADGDDVSHPERVARLAAAFLAARRQPLAICHRGWQIDAHSRRWGHLRRVDALWPLGAAMAFSPRLYREFGPAADVGAVDDEIYARRARMLGEVLVLEDRLVEYRLGTGSSTSLWNVRRVVETCTRESLRAWQVTERDLATLAARQGEAVSARWREEFAGERQRLEAKSRLVFGRGWGERLQGLKAMGLSRFPSVSAYLQLAFLLPRPLGALALLAYAITRNVVWKLGGFLGRLAFST